MFSVGKWTLATFLGWVIGVVFLLFLASVMEAIGIKNTQFVVALGMGVGVGTVQWLMFRKSGLIVPKWIWLTVFGMTIPFILFDLTNSLLNLKMGKYFLPVAVALGAILTGVLQSSWLKQKYARASLWLVASFLGWVLATLPVFSINYIQEWVNKSYLFAINLSLILVGGIILGVITGLFLKQIIKK